MLPLGKQASATLDKLTAGLTDEHPHRRIDNAPGAFMAVVVEKIGPSRYSVAHYFEQNGDLIPDPDVEFIKQDGSWFPVAITQPMSYSRPVDIDEHGRVVAYRRNAYGDLRYFAGFLLRNMKRQQGDLSPKPAARGGKEVSP